MLLKGTRFAAVMLAALTLGLGFCHLMQLPSRMGWDQYLWVGSTVQGGLYAAFGSVGAVIFVATVIALALLAYFTREHGRPDPGSRSPPRSCSRLRSCCGGCSSIRSMSSSRNGSRAPCLTIGPPIGRAGSGDTRPSRSPNSGLRRADLFGACRHAAQSEVEITGANSSEANA